MLVNEKYYRVAANCKEFCQDLIIFGTAAIETTEIRKELLSTYVNKTIRSEYEAFDNMHRADGIFSKSKLCL